MERHNLATGTGNYNHFGPIGPRDCSFSTGKRVRSFEPATPAQKAPRLDANLSGRGKGPPKDGLRDQRGMLQ